MEPTPGASAGSGYPVRLEIERPGAQSRLTNFPFLGGLIRAVLLIPHLVILNLLSLAANVASFIATFAILFTGRYPLGLFNFAVGVTRWNTAVLAYWSHLCDEYPPFSMESGNPRILLEVDYPDRSTRLLNLPWLGMLVKLVLLTPHLIILGFLLFAFSIVTLVSEFAILFTGSYPQPLHTFAVGVSRWWTRTNAYLVAITDRYPPFSLS